MKIRLFISFCIYLVFLTVTKNAIAFEYKQIELPLSNSNGVPYYKDDRGYFLEGFEVDANNNFYFLDGDKTTLVKFSINKKLLFRKNYSEFLSAQLYMLNDSLFVFDNKVNKDISNNLFRIDAKDGKLLRKAPHIINNGVNSYCFNEAFLILEIFDCYNKGLHGPENLCYVKFDLSGKMLGKVKNAYGLPDNFVFQKEYGQYLGKWKEVFVFWNVDMKSFIFWIQDVKGKIFEINKMDNKIFGEVFMESPDEHRLLKNNNIYILARKGKNALITIISLAELFPKYNKLVK